MITTSNFTNISTKFLNSSNIEVLNPNSSWKKYQMINMKIATILK